MKCDRRDNADARQLTIRNLGLAAFERLKVLLNVGQSGFQRGAAILCSTQRTFRTVEVSIIASQRGLFRRSRVTGGGVLDLDELSRQALAVLGGGADVALHGFLGLDGLNGDIGPSHS